MSQKAVFLDRDGVLNKVVLKNGKPYPPSCAADLEVFPEASEVCTRLKAMGFLLIAVTNQPDISRKTQTIEAVEAMHQKLNTYLPLDDVVVCYHDDSDDCDCRKPKPGMLVSSRNKWDLDFSQSFLIGDRWRDIAAAQSVNCCPIFIDYSYQEKQPSLPYVSVKSLSEAGDFILKNASVVSDRIQNRFSWLA